MKVFKFFKRWYAHVGLAIMIAGVIYYIQRGKLVYKRAKYTIGYVYDSHMAYKAGRRIDYKCTILGREYTGSDSPVEGMKMKGGRYLVIFDSLAPDWNGIFYDIPIPDSIQTAPDDGWYYPPFDIPEKADYNHRGH